VKALEKEVIIARKFGGPIDESGLVRELAEEGYMPKVEGKLARMRPVIDDLNERINERMKAINTSLEPVQGTRSVNQIIGRAKQQVSESVGIDQTKALRDLDALGDNIRIKYGNSLKATDINDLRIQMNKATKAFGKETFAEDAKNILGGVSRTFLDEIAPDQQVRQANIEIAKLGRMRNVSKILNDKPIKVEFWGEALGRFLGTVGGATLGIQVAGPGGLVVAGILANLGSKAVAQIIRKNRFNPKIQETIRKGLLSDEAVLNKLLKESSLEDRGIIKNASRKVGSIFKTTK